MDHSVKALPSARQLALSRVFNRHRFENAELERLFQRYIFKLQHSAISAFVALFIVLSAVLAVISFVLIQRPTLDNLYHRYVQKLTLKCVSRIPLHILKKK